MMQQLSTDTSLIKRIRALSAPLEPRPTQLAERVSVLHNIRAILFDIYGTLFISASGDISLACDLSNAQAFTQALAQARFSGELERAGEIGPRLLLEAVQRSHELRRQAGSRFPEVEIRDEWHVTLIQLQDKELIEGDIVEESIRRVSVEYECRVNPVWPMPQLAETFERLRQTTLLLGIVSNAQFYTQYLFPAFLETSYAEFGFDADLCAWSFEHLEAKPSVSLFQGVLTELERYGIAPHETLYVGNDMLNDIYPAAQLGLKTALFAGDQRSLRLRENDPRCTSLKPNVVLTDLTQLANALPGV